MERYVIPFSSIFDSIPYEIERFKSIARECGAKRVQSAYHLGWSNQPRVVRFSANPEVAQAVADKLKEVHRYIKVDSLKKD